MEQMNNKELAEKIRALGRERGYMSDAAICDAAGFDNRMVINNIEAAKMAPRLDTVLKIAQTFDVDINVLIYKQMQEVDNVLYKGVTDGVDEFLHEHNLTMSAKKRSLLVRDFYERGLGKESIKEELLKSWQYGFAKQIKVKT